MLVNKVLPLKRFKEQRHKQCVGPPLPPSSRGHLQRVHRWEDQQASPPTLDGSPLAQAGISRGQGLKVTTSSSPLCSQGPPTNNDKPSAFLKKEP